METCQDDLLQQLRKLSPSEQEAQMKVEEREAQIQELQDTITELHQEMSLKDQDKLGQLQQLVQLETRVKELTQELQSSAQTIAQLRHEARDGAGSNSVLHRDVSGDQTAARGLELLKSELTHRDASIQKLQRDLLLSHQARDSQSAQLDVQEQRLWELQRELQEKQQELWRGHDRLQQLGTELQSTTRNAQELQGQVEKLSAELSSIQRGSEAEQETQRKFRELQAELSATRVRLSDCQDGKRAALKRADEQIQQLQEEVSRLKLQLQCVSQQQERGAELRSLQKAHAELQVRDDECRRELSRIRDELHNATLRVEEQRLKEVQIDELQREVDRMLALLEKDGEDGGQEEEAERLRDEQRRLKDKLDERGDSVAALSLEAEFLRRKARAGDREAAELCRQLFASQDALQRVTGELRSCQRELREREAQRGEEEERGAELKAELNQLQHQYTTCYSQLVEDEALVSRLRTELQQAEGQRDTLVSQLQEQQHQLHLLTEKHRTAQKEVACRDDAVLKLTAELSAVQEHLTSAHSELAGQVQEVNSKAEEVTTLKEEVRRLQKLLSQRDETLEEEKGRNVQLQFEKEDLHARCESQREALCELRAEVQKWQQEAQGQRESQEKEVQALRSELREEQSRLHQHRSNLERLHRELESTQRQQRDAEDEVCRKEAALRSQDSEMTRMKADLLEARRSASDAEARLRPLGESVQLYKQKYQTCVSKIAELESTLQSHEEDRRQSRAQVVEREEQVARLQAEIVALRGDVEARCAQLESGDEALTALSRRLRDAQRELELSHAHAQERELVIDALRDNMAALRSQVEEKDEAALKLQSDFSLYRATHTRSESDCESLICRVRELEQALSQALERSGTCHSELEKLKEEAQAQKRLRDGSLAEVRRLQELMRKLQADAVCEAQSRQADVDALELRVNELEEQLEAARRHCVQKEQAVQKRDALLRQSEADLVQARDKIRGKAAEAGRHAATVQALQADLRQAKKEKREREDECGKLRTQLLQIRDELKEARSSCRDSAQELARHEEKVLLLEGGHQRAQEQLSERVAEVVRAEQIQRRLHADLRRVQQSLESSEQELHDCRTQMEQVKLEASSSRQAQLSTQQEALRLQQENQELQDELSSTKETVTHMQEQLREHSVTAQALRVELAQEQARQQEQLDWVQRTRQREDSLEAERDQLRTDLETVRNQLQERVCELHSATLRLQEEEADKRTQLQERDARIQTFSQEQAERSQEMTRLQQRLIQREERNTELSTELQQLRSQSRLSQDETRAFEGRLAELNGQLARSQLWGQQQLVTLQSREEELVLLKVEVASLRENYRSKVSQLDTLHTELDSLEQKYRAAVSEVEVLRQALGDARTDSSRLHRESELVVTNVNQWVKEQKQANEKLGLKIRDQSKKIIHLTAEKDHLQENLEKLQAEIRWLRAELDEQRMEAERCKAFQTQSASEPLHSRQPPALSGIFGPPRENVSRKKPPAVRPERS
ncbi:polyamine-modulated factor 1-binding protein 1 isoform X2 [Ictalurus punctatus]|uniref:Polyamine-modulated factor 1-binding protein 1 isoform X2 n=1 Tax=Ictalurus punctatus TaxID=7998 RepID=A0A2D0RSU4_ICTPU|nr:polyamine-modulated factor 1-binding protein 1 isoform X2 [Ictalurus punctatus]